MLLPTSRAFSRSHSVSVTSGMVPLCPMLSTISPTRTTLPRPPYHSGALVVLALPQTSALRESFGRLSIADASAEAEPVDWPCPMLVADRRALLLPL